MRIEVCSVVRVRARITSTQVGTTRTSFPWTKQDHKKMTAMLTNSFNCFNSDEFRDFLPTKRTQNCQLKDFATERMQSRICKNMKFDKVLSFFPGRRHYMWTK